MRDGIFEDPNGVLRLAYGEHRYTLPPDWKLHHIHAMETRLSVCAQQARLYMPEDTCWLLPAIEKVPRDALIMPASAEHTLLTLEKITGCIDDAYYQKYTKELQLEPWSIPDAENFARFPWFWPYFDELDTAQEAQQHV